MACEHILILGIFISMASQWKALELEGKEATYSVTAAPHRFFLARVLFTELHQIQNQNQIARFFKGTSFGLIL